MSPPINRLKLDNGLHRNPEAHLPANDRYRVLVELGNRRSAGLVNQKEYGVAAFLLRRPSWSVVKGVGTGIDQGLEEQADHWHECQQLRLREAEVHGDGLLRSDHLLTGEIRAVETA